MSLRTRLRHLNLLLLPVLLTGCKDQTGPEPPTGLFARYMALGNSITAGFESDGINDSTQAHAYPALLATSAGAPFRWASLRRPGCPPPLAGPTPLTNERVGGAPALSCAGLALPLPALIQNVGVPGARMSDALAVPGGVPGLLYTSIFGNRTPLQVVIDAQPSLVTIWLGNNDVLDAALRADAGGLTPFAIFDLSLQAIGDLLSEQTNAEEVILIGVADPFLVPLLQPGAYYWAAANLEGVGFQLPKPVSPDCAPPLDGTPGGSGAHNLVSFHAVTGTLPLVISCTIGAPFVVSPALRETITSRVATFNDAIAAQAQSRGWLYVDPNEALASFTAHPQRIRRCQGLAPGLSTQALLAAVLATCPNPAAPNFFGSLLSFDGYHPSAEAQALIAEALATAVATRHPALRTHHR